MPRKAMMKPEVAIRIINETPVEIPSTCSTTTKEYHDMLALAEHAIKKLIKVKPVRIRGTEDYKCPICNRRVREQYCDCGQLLDW